MNFAEFPSTHRVDTGQNRGRIPSDIDVTLLGDTDSARSMLLFPDWGGFDLYIDGVTDDLWVVAMGYGTDYKFIGAFDNFLEALEVAKRCLALQGSSAPTTS